MATTLNLAQPPIDLLYAIINAENPKANFTPSNLVFSDWGPRKPTVAGYNTSIEAYSVKGGGYYGKLTFNYNRINLTEFLTGTALNVTKGQYIDTHSMLPAVLDQLGIYLTTADIFNDQIATTATNTVLRISPRSLTYTGTVPVIIGTANKTLAQRVLITKLSGFHLRSV